MFARRPAPIQVNWLGYPGTMGTPWHHYVIADPWIIPPDFEAYYTEKVVRLEGDADDAHADGLKKAFQQEAGNPMQFIVAREIYKHLERITDALEDVANEIDGIVIDHA